MAKYRNAVQFNATTTGTVDFTVGSAVTGYQTPATANYANSDPVTYRAESADLTQWEEGIGSYNTTGPVVVRTTVTNNSLGTTAKISFTAAPVVGLVQLAADILAPDEANSFTTTQQAQLRTNLLASPFRALSGENLAINGAQSVSQEFLATALAGITASTKYVTDMHAIEAAGIVAVTGQQVTDAPAGFAFSLKATLTTAMPSPGLTDLLVMRHPLDGYRTQILNLGNANSQQFSVGEWVKSNVAGIYYAFSLSSGSDKVVLGKVTLVANTWTWATYTAPVITAGTFGASAAKALDVGWCLAAGTSRQSGTAAGLLTGNFRSGTDQVNWASSLTGGAGAVAPTFQRTGLVILPGTEMPTSAESIFMQRPFEEEYLRCCRWWEKSTDYGTIAAANNAGAGVGITQCIANVAAFTNSALWVYKTKKASTPTITTFNPYVAGAGFAESGAGTRAISFNHANEHSVGLRCDTACTGTGNTLATHATSNCRLP